MTFSNNLSKFEHFSGQSRLWIHNQHLLLPLSNKYYTFCWVLISEPYQTMWKIGNSYEILNSKNIKYIETIEM